ncbi:MAG: PAS domain S-box protein [Cyanobacteria bacterium SZAS-4]|nr:PAS domain S-box protein [Cyanobacteria bacterium SZAS-4]
MKLAKQGLIVICLPLIFQLLLSIFLIVWIFRAQEEVSKSVASSELVQQCDLISSSLYRSLGEAFVSFDGIAARSEMENRNLENQIDVAHQELVKIPEYREYDAELVKAGEDLMHVFRFLNVERQDHQKHEDVTPEILNLSNQLTEVTNKIVAAENARHELNFESRRRINIIHAVWIATICSMVLSLILAALCAHNTRKLVELITANAKRFHRRQPLEKPITGDDDLARVDQIFHVMDHAIREAEQREHATIDNSANLICSLTRDGAFVKANPFARQLLGYAPEKLSKLSLLDVVPPEKSLYSDEQLSASCKIEGTRSFELSLLTSDNKIVETSWSSFWSETDQSLFCVVSDITEQKKVERLKEDFIAMISDELRSPLMSVSDTISKSIGGQLGAIPEAAQPVFVSVTRSLDRLIRLVTDLLDFEKLQSGQMNFKKQRISLSSLMKQAEQEVLAHATKSNIRIQTGSSNAFVYADGERITQLLVNLLSNAIRYCKTDGVVSIVATEQKNHVEVSIIDQGPGIPPEYVEKVFTAFEVAPKSKQTKEGGSGLGLAISRLIVIGHKGTIYATNEPSGGARFTFTLPYAN